MDVNELQTKMKHSNANGFIDKTVTGYDNFDTKLIHNSDDDNMLLYIEQELRTCTAFTFAVAFVTQGALLSLKVAIADLSLKGIKGRIITSDYLLFNNPDVFKELMKLPNVEVHITNEANFHAKGYIFDHGNYQTAIIGSSNLTETALMRNYEWNIRFSSLNDGELTDKIIREIENVWRNSEILTSQWIKQYTIRYNKQTRTAITNADEAAENNDIIRPNSMQLEALSSLRTLRTSGETKALIVSATGTGKTFLGAFDVAYYKPKKFLYVVHREQIIDKTIASFRKVIGGPASDFGKLSGNEKNIKAKYVFATVQTLSRENWMKKFNPTEFDYILIDEAHRSGAESYQRVLNYFAPKFLLGMTATPERMDDFNIFETFGYNVPYEIRLQKALENKMLCPFHYVGITDYEIDGEVTTETSNMQWLVADERVDYVISQSNYYGYSGKKLRGLIFCSRTEEANIIAKLITKRGHPAKALTGSNDYEYRNHVIDELENGEIEYIITVDIFNEGIDIPSVNQVIMLRNTQSSIVFVQQLGRGLRKSPNKEFVTVIDFIGNYKNNYLIPIALTGDKSRSRDNARDDLTVRQISGVSTVSFSEIAKKKIYDTINRTALDTITELKKDYTAMKARLGRIPLLFDFQSAGTVDCLALVNRSDNYYKFLLKMKEDVHLSIQGEMILNFVSIELLNGIRQHELILLKMLIKSSERSISLQEFKNELSSRGIYFDDKILKSIKSILTLEFFTVAAKSKYGNAPIVEVDGDRFTLSNNILNLIDKEELFEKLFIDAINAGLLRADRYQMDQVFTRYEKYSRKDVCRLLSWDKDVSSTLYGYRVRNNDCPIFVTYSKSDDIDESIAYEDEFISQTLFQWYTRHNVSLTSKEGRALLDPVTRFKLFIKKNDDEGTGFYFIGDVKIHDYAQEEYKVKDKVEPIIKFNFDLDQEINYEKFLLITENT